MRFENRRDAGRRLARLLLDYKRDAPLVLGLPRGGVEVADEVAKALDAPLDVWVVRKVGAPSMPELGVGAVGQGGTVYLNRQTIEQVGASDEEIEAEVLHESAEVEARVRRFRGGRPPPQLEGRTLILVDDGIATGGTVRAAVLSLRSARPWKVVLAVPVAASQSLEELAPLVDDVVCVLSTPELYAIGLWYEDFTQVPDDEVVRLLRDAEQRQPGPPSDLKSRAERELDIRVEGATLQGTLSGPERPAGLVLFAHGSGSSRHSPRNRAVAASLHAQGLATLLFDLLTQEEESLDALTGELRFDIELLAGRLVAVTDWVCAQRELVSLPLGYFGSSTGAAAALVAAAQRPEVVRAVVSRGGRPDLAWEDLPKVRAPTLLIVGGADRQVLALNRRAEEQLEAAPHRVVVIPGATHLFEERGALEEVAQHAGQWLREHLAPPEDTEAPVLP